MPTADALASATSPARPSVIAIRRELDGYGIRFGLSEAEDARMPGPVFPTLDQAMAFIARLDRARGR
jgi:hypothetical protein